MKQHVTLRDIAREAGLSVSAVSMAMRNHPESSVATRKRVQAIAMEMGYRRDPMLSALAAYRHGDRRVLSSLAFVTTGDTPKDWRTFYGEKLFEGARQEARRLGYNLSAYWLNPALEVSRHSQILEARGVHGLLVAPLAETVGRIDLEWERFSVVVLGHSLHEPRLSRALPDQFGGLLTVFRELGALGYRRIGLVTSEESDIYIEGLWSSAVLKAQAILSASGRVKPLWHGADSEIAFRGWLEQERPDVVIAYGHCLRWVLTTGRRVPGDIGFVLLSDYPRTRYDPPFAALNHNFVEVGAAGVSLLHTQCITNSRGIPDVRVSVVVDATWVPGGTVSRKPVRAPQRHAIGGRRL